MGTLADTLHRLKQEAFSGGLARASQETLNEYAAALCHSNAFTYFGSLEFPQVCETVRLHLLRVHIESLQSHITDLDTKNTRLTKWVIALAVAALISTLIQTIVAIRVEVRAESQSQPTASAPQMPKNPARGASSGQSSSNPPIAPAAKQP